MLAPDFVCGVSPVASPWRRQAGRGFATSRPPLIQFQPQMVLTASGGAIRGRLFLCRHQFPGLRFIRGFASGQSSSSLGKPPRDVRKKRL